MNPSSLAWCALSLRASRSFRPARSCLLVSLSLCWLLSGLSVAIAQPPANAPTSRPSRQVAPTTRQATPRRAEPALRPKPTSRPAVTRKTNPRKAGFVHELQAHVTYLYDHTDLDTGLYPELRYRLRHRWWLDIEAGLRLGPPGLGDLLRYYLVASAHIKLPYTRDFALRFGWMHSSYGDIQRGDNILLFLNHIDTKYFEFHGGIALRFVLPSPQTFRNPFLFPADYTETTLLFDIRAKVSFSFPKLPGSRLTLAFGIMDFSPSEILVSNTIGYQLIVSWLWPKVGLFELNAGMMSYSILDLAGFFGRFFVRFGYTFFLKH